MRIDLTQSRLEKDFEQFVKRIGTLGANDFCGLCRILKVELYENEADLKNVKKLDLGKSLEEMDEEERKEAQNKIEEWKKNLAETYPPRPAENVLNDAMDRFLELNKRRRREIIDLLKDYQRGL